MHRRTVVKAALVTPWTWLSAASVAQLPPQPSAAAFPSRPVRILVAFPPGGATDVVARVLAAKLAERWGQPVVVENRPGAGGNIAGEAAANAAPDGHVLLMSSPAELAINPHLYKRMPFDPTRDFVAVSQVATAPLVLVVHSSVPAGSLDELIALAKTKAGGLSYASSGSGGPQHLAGALMESLAGVKMTHVPYKGGAPAIADLLGAQVDMFFAGVPPALPHLKGGRIRAIAVTSPRRSQLLPELPTMAQAGLPGFAIENWQGLVASAATPPSVVARIASDVASVVADAAFGASLREKGAEPVGSGPAEFRAFVRSEFDKYARLVKLSGASAD